MTHFNNKELKTKIVEFIRETGIPCSIDFVAQKFRIGWGTTRAILLNLIIEERITAQKTTNGLLFLEKKTDKN
jgi:hypothetical protein